jgi:DNA processing protein
MLGVGREGACWRAEGPAGGEAPDAPVLPAPQGRVRGPISDESERDAWVVLDSVPGVGPVSFARLIEAFGDAEAVLRAATRPRGPSLLVASTSPAGGGSPSLGADAARAVADAARDSKGRLEPLRRAGVLALTLGDPDYPSRLRRIELPPPVLYVQGSNASLDRDRAVAVVGTRRPTAVGRATSGRIADAIAGLGATVVSGLALGIDAAAHAAALRAGGTTVAVIGGGHGHLYPAGHRGLARSIVAQGGAVISEFAPDTVPSRGTFPRRNRIISGLADATVVVEAGVRSGALTTAAWALEQGRGLHIVPGRLDDPAVAGCLAFRREAGPEARVVAGVAELIEDLGLLGGDGRSSATRRPPSVASIVGVLSPPERAVARALAAGRGSVDELIAATGQSGATVLGVLTTLEGRGLAVETFGRFRAAGPLASGRSHGTGHTRLPDELDHLSGG